jgi:hypothetical protein
MRGRKAYRVHPHSCQGSGYRPRKRQIDLSERSCTQRLIDRAAANMQRPSNHLANSRSSIQQSKRANWCLAQRYTVLNVPLLRLIRAEGPRSMIVRIICVRRGARKLSRMKSAASRAQPLASSARMSWRASVCSQRFPGPKLVGRCGNCLSLCKCWSLLVSASIPWNQTITRVLECLRPVRPNRFHLCGSKRIGIVPCRITPPQFLDVVSLGLFGGPTV